MQQGAKQEQWKQQRQQAAPTQAHFYLSGFLFGSFFLRYLVSILSTHKNSPAPPVKVLKTFTHISPCLAFSLFLTAVKHSSQALDCIRYQVSADHESVQWSPVIDVFITSG
jgi:alpha/beta superfamily hydrolase